jgi:hypothetical protein
MTLLRSFSLIALALPLLAQSELRYRLLPSAGEAPEPRLDGTIIYSPRDRAVVLFGGQGNGLLNDVWSYSLTGQRWERWNVTGAAPAPRLGHTSVYDPVRHRLIVFGGQARGFFNDVWALDLAARSWRQLSDASGPSTRYGHSAIYDPRGDRLIVTHGFTSAGRFDDTWAFDFASSAWRNLNPTGNKPLRRCLQHTVYDPARHQMLMYGGCSSGAGPCPQTDLWALDLAANRWTLLANVTMPAGREHYGMVFDEARGRLVIHGGRGNGALGDTWDFNFEANQWMASPLAGTPLGARSRHHGAWVGGEMVFFGGILASGGLTNELWALGGSVAPALRIDGVSNALSGAGGAVAPGEWVSVYGMGFGGARVTVNGAAPMVSFAGERQVNLRVPETVGARAEFAVEAGGARAASELPVARVHPGIVALSVADVVVIYATGAGTGAGARAYLNGDAAEVLYAGPAPGIVGLQQVNARSTRTGSVEAQIEVEGVRSNTVSVMVPGLP